jgi:septum formation protein
VDGHRLILASASPRRRALLEQVGLAFDVEPVDVEEGDDPVANAAAKARAVAVRHAGEDVVVLGADTEVILDGEVLGKPADAAAAAAMLRRLSARTHAVVTAYALVHCGKGEEVVRSVETAVTFRALSDDEIGVYVATGEPLDKAGAYGIQERGAALVARIEGDYPNVVGLPVGDVVADLRRLGVQPS